MGLLTLGFAVCPLVQGREGRLLSGRLAMDQELQGRGLGPGFLHARVGPQARPFGHLHRVRAWVGRVVPLALQAFDPAFHGHEIIGTVA